MITPRAKDFEKFGYGAVFGAFFCGLIVYTTSRNSEISDARVVDIKTACDSRVASLEAQITKLYDIVARYQDGYAEINKNTKKKYEETIGAELPEKQPKNEK